MTTTPNLGLPLVAAAQAQKHVTVNESLQLLDALVQLTVIDRDLNSPPAAVTDGDTYIIGPAPTGAWVGQANKIVVASNGSWVFLAPKTGWKAFLLDENREVIWDGSVWNLVTYSYDPQVNSVSGATMFMGIVEEEVTVSSGATVSSTVFFPDRSIIHGVSTRVTETITGPTDLRVGVLGNSTKFATGLPLGVGSSNVGVIGPDPVYSNTPVLLTAHGGDFTGGKVRVSLQYIQLTAPTS